MPEVVVAGMPAEEIEVGGADGDAVAAAALACGVADADAAAALVSGVAPVGAEAVVGVVAGAGAVAVAAPGAEERASGLGGQLNADCDAGGCGSHVAAWPLWMPPFSYAWCFPRFGYPSSRLQKKWSSPHSGTGHERSLCPPHYLNGLND